MPAGPPAEDDAAAAADDDEPPEPGVLRAPPADEWSGGDAERDRRSPLRGDI